MKPELKQTKILITGGAGFIGSNLIETLLQMDNEVVCLDNFITGKRENLTPFLGNPARTCRKYIFSVSYRPSERPN